MAVQTTYPGVYIQEVPSGVHTITGVSTSIGLFIGQANWGPLNKPVLCLSNSDFERNFTADTSQGNLPRAVKLFFLNGGTQCYVIRVCGTGNLAAANAATTITATAKSPGVLGNSFYFETKQSTIPGDNTFHLKFYRLADPANTDAKTELQEWDKVSMIAGTPRFIEKYAINNWVSFTMTSAAITTMPADGTYQLAGGLNGNNVTSGDYTAANLVAEKQIDLFNLMVLPENVDLGAGPFVAREDLWGDASSFCEARRAFLIMDPPDAWTDTVGDIGATLPGLRTGLAKDNSAIYFPNLIVQETAGPVTLGPSGAIAGLMARIDTTRGVWKAPAGTEADLRGIKGLEYRLTDGENGVLNPQGVNVIRVFPNGIVNWGARTMDGDDDFASDWKYVPVRRTALFMEESLYRGLKWVVFEPNDERLWGQIRLNVGAFMHSLFRQGAFQGTRKDDAYFVKCDAETTTQNDINLGIVNVWVGFAPLKPAEFVILYLQQMAGQIQV